MNDDIDDQINQDHPYDLQVDQQQNDEDDPPQLQDHMILLN